MNGLLPKPSGGRLPVRISSKRTPVLIYQCCDGFQRFSANSAKVSRGRVKGAPLGLATYVSRYCSRSYSKPATKTSFAEILNSLCVLAAIRRLSVKELPADDGKE